MLEGYASWASALRYEELPADVIEAAKAQIVSAVAAAIAGAASPQGAQLARALSATDRGHRTRGSEARNDPSASAQILAGWSMIHEYDDVMLGGHLSHSSVWVPLTLAWQYGGTGRDVILAQVVANEVAGRVNAACTLGQTRGQMATYLHLLSAAAARTKFENASADTIADAMAFALSCPARFFFPSFLGSDAKFLCASWPLRIGWEAVDCVREGLSAHRDTVAGRGGFIEANAGPLPQGLLDTLGREWLTQTNSIKASAVCGYHSAAVECALRLREAERIPVESIEEVVVDANIFSLAAEKRSHPYVREGRPPISALSFSASFAVASALAHGELTHDNYHGERLADARVWALKARTRVRHSMTETAAALFHGIPIGAVLKNVPFLAARRFIRHFVDVAFPDQSRMRRELHAARLALRWWREASDPPTPVAKLTKPLGAGVTLRCADGRVAREHCAIPRGFAGTERQDGPQGVAFEKLARAARGSADEQGMAEMARTLESLEGVDAPVVGSLVEYLFSGKRRVAAYG